MNQPSLPPTRSARLPDHETWPRWLLAAGGLLVLPFGLLAWHGRFLPPLWVFLAAFATAFAVYALAVWRLRGRSGRRVLMVVIGTGAACRILALQPEIGLSDDIYRYLWEGKVGNAGINPYTHAPDDPALLGLDDSLRRKVAHREVPAVYPPLAQLAFRLVAGLGGGPRAWRLLMILADLSALGLLARLLRREGLPEGHLLIYAWNPLLIVELAGSGHVDGLVLPFLVLTVGWLLARRVVAATGWLALATLAKLHVAAILPFFVLRRRGLAALALFSVLLAGAYAPYWDQGTFRGIELYGKNWSFNSPAYDAARWLAGDLREGIIRLAETRFTGLRGIAYGVNPEVLARGLLALAFLAVLSLALCRRNDHRRDDPPRTLLTILAAFVLLSPTVHPWYLVWLVPLLTLRPSGPLLLLTGSVALTYQTVARFRIEGVWVEETWVRIAEYLPVIAWMAFELARQGWRSRSGSSGRPTATP